MKYLITSENQIAILLTIAIVGLGFPYGFPLFSLVGLFFLVLNLFHMKISFKINKYVGLYFMAIIAYVWGLIIGDGLKYQIVKSDVINIIGYFITYIVFSGLKQEHYKSMIKKFSTLAITSGFIVSLISFYKYYKLLNGKKLAYFTKGNLYPWGTSLVTDYNMFSLFLVVSLLFSIARFETLEKGRLIFINFVMTILITISILLSGSRRGLIVVVIIYLFSGLKFILKKIFNKGLRFNIYKAKKLLLIIVVVLISFYLIIISFNAIDFSYLNTYEIEKLINRASTLSHQNFGNAFSQRTNRWVFALDIANQSGFSSVVFGNGFSYIESFTNRFLMGIGEDHPHMPVLSALLYSGIFGFLITVGVLIIPIVLLLKYYEHYGIELLYVYIVSLFYFLVSSNSIFSIKFFNLFLLLLFTCNPTSKAKQN